MSDKDWKTNPTIQAAGRLLHDLGATHVMVIYRMPDEAVRGVSYGSNGKNCREAGKIVDWLLSRFMELLTDKDKFVKTKK